MDNDEKREGMKKEEDVDDYAEELDKERVLLGKSLVAEMILGILEEHLNERPKMMTE